jgi:hypothetical protein
MGSTRSADTLELDARVQGAGSRQSFNHPMILSSAGRARPVPSLPAALRRLAAPPCCCSRRGVPTTCQP